MDYENRPNKPIKLSIYVWIVAVCGGKIMLSGTL